MPAANKVLIIGAGISGLTLGIALRQRGIHVVIVEINENVRHQAGVGLSLQGNSIAALGKIGLAAACLKAGMPGNYLNIRRPNGELITHQPILPMGGSGYPGTAGISRSVLHRILLDAVDSEQATLRLGVTFDTLDADEDGVMVTFSDGSSDRFDLVVGADGLYSKVRGLLFPDIKPEYCGQSIWRAGVPRPKGNFTTELHLGGSMGAVGICPISIDEAYTYVIELAEKGVRHEGPEAVAIMLDRLNSYGGPLLEHCKEALLDSTSVSFRPLESLLVPDSWHVGKIVIIGDAAHSGPPVLAQGAAMGMEDAVVLSEALVQYDNVTEALNRFMARRYHRAKMVVENSVQICRWEVEHSASPQDVARLMGESQRLLSQPF